MRRDYSRGLGPADPSECATKARELYIGDAIAHERIWVSMAWRHAQLLALRCDTKPCCAYAEPLHADNPISDTEQTFDVTEHMP